MSSIVALPPEVRDQIRALGHEIADFFRAFDAWYTVSESGTRSGDLMDRYAPMFFVELQGLLVDHIILQLGRLAGSAQSSGQRNLTVRGVVEAVMPHLSAQDQFDLDWNAKSFDRHAKQFVAQRHKRVAHRDLDIAVQNAWDRLPTGKNADVLGARFALEPIRKILVVAMQGDTEFFDQRPEALGLSTILAMLERCDEWTRLREMERGLTDEELRLAVRRGQVPETARANSQSPTPERSLKACQAPGP